MIAIGSACQCVYRICLETSKILKLMEGWLFLRWDTLGSWQGGAIRRVVSQYKDLRLALGIVLDLERVWCWAMDVKNSLCCAG